MNQTIRVGVLTSSVSRSAGGLFVSVRRLAQSLNALKGVEVNVLGLSDRYSEEDIGMWSGVPVELFDTLGPRAFGFAPRMSDKLELDDYSVLHTQGLWMFPSVATSKWYKRTGRPYVVTPRGMLDSWALNNSGIKKRLALLAFENGHLQEASCIHALCESEYQSIRACGLRNPVCIIPNGIDGPGFDVSINEADAFWPCSEKVLVFLGRIHPKKGLVNLINAWLLLKRESSVLNEWRLLIAGWDQESHQSELESLLPRATDVGIDFIGPKFGKEKDLLLRRADAFVLPSFSEGLPMSVLEAWSYSIPALITPQCNLPEGFQFGAALRIETNQDSIVDVLGNFVKMSEQKRTQMGVNGAALVKCSFGWEKVSLQMLNVYLWLLGKGERPECVRVD